MAGVKMINFLSLVVTWSLNFLIAGLMLYGIWYWGEAVGYQDGYSTAIKSALKTNPPSDELEMVCAGLWFGEQNQKVKSKHQ